MGFKRTSEGRVFFQGKSDNDQSGENFGFGKSPKAQELRKNIEAQSHGTQTQIVTLLKALNERLKVTQAERSAMRKELDAYRNVIESLEEKSDRSERAYLTLEQKLSQHKGGADPETEEILTEAIKELEVTRKTLFDLEDRAQRSDKKVDDLKTEIARTKSLGSKITERQKTIEDIQRQQDARMADGYTSITQLIQRVKTNEEKQEIFDAKLEDTANQQAKLFRKIDKATEDRARFMRKIERIEETVLQTRDSLNSKAMVLLTEQGVAGAENIDVEALDFDGLDAQAQTSPRAPEVEYRPPFTHQTQGEEVQYKPWMKNSILPQAAGVASIVAVLGLGVWFVSQLQSPQYRDSAYFETAAYNPVTDSVPSSEIDVSSRNTQTQTYETAQAQWDVSRDTSTFAPIAQEQAATPAAPTHTAPEPLRDDDLGTINVNDAEQLEQLLQTNPNAVAEALNNIEPSKPAKPAPEVRVAAVEKPVANPEPASKPAKPATQKNISSNADLKALIDSDPQLSGVMKDIEMQAFEGIPEAQHDLAAVYTAGHGGVSQDYPRAAFWFEQAADGGVANAAYNLGVLHHQGLGVSADISNAIDWYTRAADLGHPEAQYNLGIAYIEGIGVSYDAQKAAKYFKSAADQNIMEAAYNLGLIYENGLLSEAKPDEALMWYKIAADQGSPEAQQALEQLAKTLNISIDDVNKLAESMKTLNQSSAQASQRAGNTASTSRTQSQSSQSGAALQLQALTAQIQEYLMAAGLYPGPADGINGPLTTDAVRSYQSANRIVVDGKVSEGLLTHMLGNENLGQGSREN